MINKQWNWTNIVYRKNMKLVWNIHNPYRHKFLKMKM